MNHLLDTCVLSELTKKAPDSRVVAWLRGQYEERLYLSVLTLGELQKGVTKLADAKRRRELQRWLDDDLTARFAGRVLDVTAAVAITWGRLQGQAEHAGRKLPVIDGLIAATALSFGASVVTRNESDLAASGVAVVNPWSPRAR